MSSNFDWHIGEESGGRENPSSKTKRASNGRKYLIMGIVVILGLVYFVLANRAEWIETAVTDDIMTRFNLLWEATQRQDKELFRSLRDDQSSRTWKQQIDTLFARNMLFDRQSFGLHLLSDPPQITDVIVSPDLRQATLLANLHYQTETDLVTLQQTFAFDYHSEMWQLSQPPALWWTDGEPIEGERLVVFHQEQDTVLIERLAHDLDQFLDEVCASLTVDTFFQCRSEQPLQLLLQDTYHPLFSPAPQGQDEIFGTPYRILPSPLLIGLPQDEAGYQALRRGYAQRLLQDGRDFLFVPTAAFASDPRFSEAMLRQLMVTEGLRSWSPTPDMSMTLVEPMTLLCLNEAGSGLDVRGYDEESAVWHILQQIPGIQTVYRLPDGVILVQTEQAWQLVWYDGMVASLPAVAEAEIRPGGDGRHLLAITPAQTYQLDIAQCQQSDCNWQVGTVASALSPDGVQLIKQTTQGLQRTGSGSDNAVTIGQGYAPFWISDRIYGYLRPQGTEVEIVAAHIADDNAYHLTTTAILRAAIPNNESVSALYITHVAAHPDDFTSLLISAYAPAPLDREYTFSLYRITGEVFLVEQEQTRPLGNLSPDGRYTTYHEYDADNGRWTFSWSGPSLAQPHKIIFEQVFSPPLYTLTWSSHSETMALLYDGVLTLIQPDSDTQQIIVPPVPGCVDAAWLSEP